VNLADRIRLGFDRFNERDWEAVQRGLPEVTRAAPDHGGPPGPTQPSAT
jgi:hypothetical protein